MQREDVEKALKSLAQIKRVRVSEFFKDFDPLRSGFITSESGYQAIQDLSLI